MISVAGVNVFVPDGIVDHALSADDQTLPELTLIIFSTFVKQESKA